MKIEVAQDSSSWYRKLKLELKNYQGMEMCLCPGQFETGSEACTMVMYCVGSV